MERLSDLVVPALADVCVIDVQRERAPAAAGRRRARAARRRDPRRACAARAARTGTASTRRPRWLGAAAPDRARRRRADLRAAALDDDDLRFLRDLDGRSHDRGPAARARADDRHDGPASSRLRRAGATAPTTSSSSRVLSGRVALALDNAGLFTELESVEAQRSAALGTLAEAVTVQDADGRLVYANAAARAASASTRRTSCWRRAPSGSATRLGLASGGRLAAAISSSCRRRRVLRGEPAEPLLAAHRPPRDGRGALAAHQGQRRARPHGRAAPGGQRHRGRHRRQARRVAPAAPRRGRRRCSPRRSTTRRRWRRSRGWPCRELADWCARDDARRARLPALGGRRARRPGQGRLRPRVQRALSRSGADEGGSAQVIREGRSQLVNEIPDELLVQAVSDPEQLAALRDLGMRAAMIVPMVTPAASSGRSALSAPSRAARSRPARPRARRGARAARGHRGRERAPVHRALAHRRHAPGRAAARRAARDPRLRGGLAVPPRG